MRYFTLFLAAMLFTSNAAAAARACLVDLAGHQPAAIHVLAANASEPLCPPSDDTGPCLKHFAQSYQSEDQKFWSGVPAAALVPARAVLHLAFHAPPKLIAAASVPPIAGLSLTILYGNFRN